MVNTAVIVSVIGLSISFLTFLISVVVKSLSERRSMLTKNIMDLEKEWAEHGRDNSDFLIYFMEKYGWAGFLGVFTKPVGDAVADALRAQKARAHLFGFWSRFAILHDKGYLPRDVLEVHHQTFHWHHRVQQYIFVALPFDRAVKPFQGLVGHVYDEWCDSVQSDAGQMGRRYPGTPQHYVYIIDHTVGNKFKDPWADDMWVLAYMGPLFVNDDDPCTRKISDVRQGSDTTPAWVESYNMIDALPV